MTTKITPKLNMVSVTKFPPETHADGSEIILLPDVAKKLPQLGIVAGVGPGLINKNGFKEPIDLKPDDIVVFKRFSGHNIKIKGKEHFLIPYHDILAKIEVSDDNPED